MPKKLLYKVYITYYETGEYYIGVTSKSGVHFDNYFGSNNTDLKVSHKDILFHTHNKSDAKLMELIYQPQTQTIYKLEILLVLMVLPSFLQVLTMVIFSLVIMLIMIQDLLDTIIQTTEWSFLQIELLK